MCARAVATAVPRTGCCAVASAPSTAPTAPLPKLTTTRLTAAVAVIRVAAGLKANRMSEREMLRSDAKAKCKEWATFMKDACAHTFVADKDWPIDLSYTM